MLDAIYPVIGSQSKLPFYLTGIGIAEPEYHVKREEGLISHQFLYTKSGRGKLVVGGHSYQQKEGSLFYLSPGVPHEYYPLEDNWTTCWMVFRGAQLSSFMKELGFLPWMVQEETDLRVPQRLFHMMLVAAGDPVDGAERCSVLVYEYIFAMRKLFVSEAGSGIAAGSVIEKAIRYIDMNYQEDITLQQMASLSNVSLQHFCRVFKAQIGMRPMEYIARRRISEAKHLLCNTDKSISEIGALTGYSDPTYFGMVFKKYEGLSPSQFRKLQGSLKL